MRVVGIADTSTAMIGVGIIAPEPPAEITVVAGKINPTAGCRHQAAPYFTQGGFMRTISMTQDVYDSILTTIGAHPPETGGILGSDLAGTVRAFHFDCPTQRSSITYYPSVHALSTIINEAWLPQGLIFSGLVHSHPKASSPSPRDIQSTLEIMKLNSLSVFLLPIVAGHQIDMYVLERYPDDSFQLTKEIIHIMR